MKMPPMLLLSLRQVVKSWLPRALPMFDDVVQMNWTTPFPVNLAELTSLSLEFKDGEMYAAGGSKDRKRMVIIILSEHPISEVFDLLEEQPNA